MPTDRVESAERRIDPFSHVAAVHRHAGAPALWRAFLLNLRHPWQVGIAIGATIVACSLQLWIPRLLGHAVDQARPLLSGNSAGMQQALWSTAILLLVVSVLRGGFTLLQNYFSESVGHHAAYELRLACYEKLQRLSFSFHDRMHSGDLIMLGIIDIDGVRMFFSTGLVRFVLLFILIGVGAYLLLSTDVLLGLLSLSFVPFVGWRSSAMQLTLRRTWIDLQERMTVLSRVMEENLGGIRVVRAFSAALHELGKFDRASKSALELAHQRVALRVVDTAAMNLSFFVSMGLVLWFGGHKVMAGEMSVGTLTSFLTFMTILQMPVRQIGLLVNSFARASTCGQRLFALLDLELAVKDEAGAMDLVVSDGTLSFENVSFSYPGANDNVVLSGIDFTARRGQTIGIVGPPGSGKSTIAHLIPRFYDVSSGTIRIDGQDISKVALKSLRKAVSVVQQDPFLFTTTIENNIAYGNPWAKEQRIERAAEYAQLHNYIVGLPTGYETVVGERGASLSGGQRQRMSIARTLILRPAILVLDDSTAAIDAGTEQRIRAAMRRDAAERVTLIIAHRLSSLMHADLILFIENGRIVERGTHDELLRSNGRYRALYDLQVRPADAVEAAE